MDVTTLDSNIRTIEQESGSSEYAESLIRELCVLKAGNPDLPMASLLRLLAIDENLLYMSVLRRQALTLIKERLSEAHPFVARHYLDKNAQADQVCRQLARVLPDANDRLRKALDSYGSPRDTKTFREQLLTSINHPLCKATITPFIVFEGDTTQVLRLSLTAIVDYLDSDVAQARFAYREARRLLKSQLKGAGRNLTSISIPLVNKLECIYDDLATHYANSMYSKPAQMELDVDLRRHPLHEPDLRLSIPVKLNNVGSGTAIDVEVKLDDALGLSDFGPPIQLARVDPGSIVIEIGAATDTTGLNSDGSAYCEFDITWINADGSDQTIRVDKYLKPQGSDVDWRMLVSKDPYSLEAVTTKARLAGRSQMLEQMVATLSAGTVGSVYIHGQKRVGKTSLANVALDILSKDHQLRTVFVDIGKINHPDPTQAIDNLVEYLIRRISYLVPSSSYSQEYRYNPNGSLGPLVQLLDSIAESPYDTRLAIALDEFDRLPISLFRRNSLSDTFFLGLRSISTIKGIGLMLIGGERMQLILGGPGVELNRFGAFEVDCIDRSTQWHSFTELVRNPTRGSLEFSDIACEQVYKYTEGNPYYAKLVCKKILELSARRRDSFVDIREVDSAVELLLTDLDATSFSHYWEDYVLETDAARDEVTLNRRRCLLAFGNAISSEPSTDDGTSKTSIVREGALLGLDSVAIDRELRSFQSRRILTALGDRIGPRVLLFGRWITSRGQEKIVMSAGELESVGRAVMERSRYRISLEEVDQLVSEWDTYNGSTITTERVVDYLRQFGDDRKQRMIFTLLKKIYFVGRAEERKLLQTSYRLLEQTMKERYNNWKRDQIRISYCGPYGKSSSLLARQFAKVNGFTVKWGMMRPRLLQQSAADGVRDVVIVDDFCGTGETLEGHLASLANQVSNDQIVHLFILVGMSGGVDRINRAADSLFKSGHFFLHCLHELEGQQWVFKTGTAYFDSVDMASDARKLAKDIGAKLEPKIPLGYGDCCALVTFSNSIPNNAPPILWSESSGQFRFRPLFRRH